MFSKEAIVVLMMLSLTSWAAAATIVTTDVDSATQKLFGVHCLMGVVNQLNESVGDFGYSTQLCGDTVKNSIFAVTADNTDLTNTIAFIQDINKSICQNSAYKDDDAKRTPTFTCSDRIKTMMTRLNSNIVQTIRDIKSLTNIKPCGMLALTSYQSALENVGTYVKTCGDLTKAITN